MIGTAAKRWLLQTCNVAWLAVISLVSMLDT